LPSGMNFIKKFMAHARGPRARRLCAAKVATRAGVLRRGVSPRSNYILLIDISFANDGQRSAPAGRPASREREREREREEPAKRRGTRSCANPPCASVITLISSRARAFAAAKRIVMTRGLAGKKGGGGRVSRDERSARLRNAISLLVKRKNDAPIECSIFPSRPTDRPDKSGASPDASPPGFPPPPPPPRRSHPEQRFHSSGKMK